MLRTGLAYSDITPEGNLPLFGYSDRIHESTGVHDPLWAYTWYLETENHQPMAWVTLDLCILSLQTIQDLKITLAEQTGIKTERIFISTSHTHSAPDLYIINEYSESRKWHYFQYLIDRVSVAIQEAKRNSFPGCIEMRTGQCRLGVNRRNKDDPIDPRLTLISLLDESGDRRGLLFHYPCHLTVLGVDNYLISADWVGPVRNSLQRELDIPVGFIQGAEGNIDPISRGELDMSDPEQAVGSSFEELERMSEIMIQSIKTTLQTRPVTRVDTIRSVSFHQQLPLRYGPLNQEEVLQKIAQWKEKFATFLDIPISQVPEEGIINAYVKDRCRQLSLPPEQTRKWVAEQFTYVSFLWIYHTGSKEINSERGTILVPTTLFDFETLLILGLPLEVLVEVAFEWQERFPDRIALLTGLFDGWIGYFPHGKNYEEENASSLYETISTVFAPEAAAQLLDAAQGKLQEGDKLL